MEADGVVLLDVCSILGAIGAEVLGTEQSNTSHLGGRIVIPYNTHIVQRVNLDGTSSDGLAELIMFYRYHRLFVFRFHTYFNLPFKHRFVVRYRLKLISA